MKRFMIWCSALLLMVACGGNANPGSDSNAANTKDSAIDEKARTNEDDFIAVTDTMLVGRWVSAEESDSAVLSLALDGSVNTKGLKQNYTSWKQVMANVIVLIRPGVYGGTAIDTAYINVDTRPMTLETRGFQPLKLKQQ